MIRIAIQYADNTMVVFEDVSLGDEPESSQIYRVRSWASKQPGVLRVLNEGEKVLIQMKPTKKEHP